MFIKTCKFFYKRLPYKLSVDLCLLKVLKSTLHDMNSHYMSHVN